MEYGDFKGVRDPAKVKGLGLCPGTPLGHPKRRTKTFSSCVASGRAALAPRAGVLLQLLDK